jgi:hypothetical protein
MRRVLVTVTALLTLAAAASASAQGKKNSPAPTWPCQIVFRDAAADVIKSDTAPGSAAWPKPYRDGVEGVTCYILDSEGATKDRWLYLKIESTRKNPSSRYLQVVGQTYPQLSGSTATYPSFQHQNGGDFEVKGLALVEWNPADPT